MKRKEQIEKGAFNYINSDAVSPENMQLAFGDFINGVKWADETMIEKALQWLEEKNKMCMYELEMILGKKFIDDFKKAMEE